MTDSEFKKLLSDPEKLSGGYLFFGEEDFVKSRYADLFAKAVVGDESFSAISIEGPEMTPSALAEALGSVSMFGGRRFVRVDHAQVDRWKKKSKKSEDEDGDDGLLDKYCEIFAVSKDDPDLAYCIIVDSDAADFGILPKKPNALYKKLTEYLTPVCFGAAAGAQLRNWIERHILSEALRMEYGAADTLVSVCGQDLFTLKGECEKLAAYAKAHGADTVTSDMVKTVAAPNIIEEAFELSNAIVSGDKKKALHALYGAKSRREEPIVVMGMISRVVSDMLAAAVYSAGGLSVSEIARRLKLHEYTTTLYLNAGSDIARLTETLRRCLEADKQLKSSARDYAPIERLICST